MLTATVPRFGDVMGPCQGDYGTRRIFYLEGVRVILPEAVTEKALRWLIDQGMSFNDAYRNVGWWDEIPPEGMRRCCYDVLRTKWYDATSDTWKLSGWGHTCAGYFGCFESYVEAQRETARLGRIKIAEGVYAPSPAEEACIKQRHHHSNNIARAYTECDALDILPTFPGAVEGLNKVMRSSITTPMYEMIKTLYGFKPEPLPNHEPNHHAPPPPDGDWWASNKNYVIIGAAMIGAALLLRK